MNGKVFIMSLLTLLCSLFGCQAQSNKKYKSVTPDEFEKVIADTNVIRLDVRKVEEFADGHIQNAINIDVLSDDFTDKAIKVLDKKKVIALYCRSGRRSKKAADILSAKGYKIVELDNGYLGWLDAKKAVVK